MSDIAKVKGGWRVRWREAGRGSPRRSRTFKLKGDAELFESEVKRRKALGELSYLEASRKTVAELAGDWWQLYAKPNLAYNTLAGYAMVLDKHVLPRIGGLKLRDVTPEVLARFRADLEAAGVGRHAVRVSLVVVQAMYARAREWGWVTSNPARAVQKPSGQRARAVVCLEPERVEAIRDELLDGGRDYAALICSLVAYAGLRFPEEVLALEWSKLRARTLLVEQRLINGEVVPGQKVRHFRPRAIDLVAPLRQDLAAYQLAQGRPTSGLVFPRRDGQPWKITDVNNWRRRVWHPARDRMEIRRRGLTVTPSGKRGAVTAKDLRDALAAVGVPAMPPYDLRHAFASLQIRAGVSIPELAEQMGHSPKMTLDTYAHVMRELKGEPAMTAEAQIQAARRTRGPQVDHPEASGG